MGVLPHDLRSTYPPAMQRHQPTTPQTPTPLTLATSCDMVTWTNTLDLPQFYQVCACVHVGDMLQTRYQHRQKKASRSQHYLIATASSSQHDRATSSAAAMLYEQHPATETTVQPTLPPKLSLHHTFGVLGFVYGINHTLHVQRHCVLQVQRHCALQVQHRIVATTTNAQSPCIDQQQSKIQQVC